ncbi:YIP1 family protein [Brevibacillus humidisoli]|uniref:YIP1 family protein n=1 Tax=Brevibacillus humidisoli TaxID=2895522 RepID=UPI001E4A7F40|nr:YIP1 family protein [Brevibacillus humidisoli]UFJ42081.1 YIP1 family protein [Brevibacillus humidisoli]
MFQPWLTIWTRPRETVRDVLLYRLSWLIAPVMILSGIGEVLNRAATKSMGDTHSTLQIFGFAILVGPLSGLLTLFLGSWLLHLTGKWMKGAATLAEVRTAVACGNIPLAWLLLLWIPEYLLFGKELFTSRTPVIDSNPFLLWTLLAFLFMELVGTVWAFICFIHCLGEVQRFSAWKALGNTVVAVLIGLIPLLLLASMIGLSWMIL